MRLKDIKLDLLNAVESSDNYSYREYEEKGERATACLCIRFMRGDYYSIAVIVRTPGLPELKSKPHVLETYDFKRVSAFLSDYVERLNNLLGASFFTSATVKTVIRRENKEV